MKIVYMNNFKEMEVLFLMDQMFSNDNGIQIIAQYYGEDAQKNVVQEECAELIQAICKDNRYNTNRTRQHMIEEMSDVYLALSTLNYFLTDEERKFLIENFNAKVNRQLGRIEEDVRHQDIEKVKEIKNPCNSCDNWSTALQDCTGYMNYHNCGKYQKWRHIKEMKEDKDKDENTTSVGQ